jgi:uncharacterized repeat protein (TIGR01451 family)
MAANTQIKQFSSSWSESLGAPDPTMNQILQQLAAQGQSYFQDIGDGDAWVGPIDQPSDSPYVTSVGGTILTMNGSGTSYASETVWQEGYNPPPWGGNGQSGYWGTGGGVSTFYSIPSWQQGVNMSTNGGSTTMRNVPDVALTAENIWLIFDNGQEGPSGGTSAATPLWAAFTALVNQQAAAASQPPIGFINPALYAIGKGSSYTSCFHDITTGNNTWSNSLNNFFAVPGYDLCTGWGTPAGTNLINALVAPVARPSLIVVSNYVFGGNGNGLIDYNECNNLNLILRNVGNAGATGVSATLLTTTPEVAIAQPTSAYPNIPIGASATNLVPFKVSTSPSFVCGTPIDCSLLLQFDQGASLYRFSLPSGVPGNPFRFDNDSLVTIPSPGSTNSAIVVSNISSAVNKVTVSLFVAESFDYYLNLQLIAPDGTTCTLSTNNGLSGQNYGVACSPDSQRTTFDDAATTPIASGSAPFLGAFQPAQPLSIFIGKSGTNVNGVWQLQASDQSQGDTAAIQCWSLLITPALCTDGGGQCPGADMALGMTAQPSPFIVGKNLVYNIAVTNLGPSAVTNASVTHLLPANVTLVSVSASQGIYAQQGNVIIFNLGAMAARATATLTVVVQPTVAGKMFSTATVSSEQPDFNLANNSATVQTLVNPPTADLAVGIAAVPNPVLIGGTLTYTVSLTNNGPSPATLITVTNVLPDSVQIKSITVSGGTTSILGDVVLWTLPSLAAGVPAFATITVIPTTVGLITATAAAGGQEFDPITSNNTASITTTVGPAADLALSLTGFPNPVVTGSNVTYTIAVSNLGPSTATGVSANESLPPAFTVLSTNATQGTIVISNHTLFWSLGTLANAAGASLTMVAATTTNGTFSTTATVLATQADPNPANNTATVTTLVAAPFVSLVPAGATLTYESGPTNGAIDAGETVTLVLRLSNAGNVSTRNLVATLLATNGVAPVPPNSPQTFGVLLPSGFPVGRPFSFTANGSPGGTVSPTLQLQDGTNPYPPVSFTFTLSSTQTSANTNIILIPDPAAPNPPYPMESGPAKPYPSAITVSNFVGLLGKVSVTLSNFSHTYPSDVNVLLVAPGGANALIMSHAGNQPVVGLNLTFDDAAPEPLPAAGTLASGVWQPTAYSPAPLLGGFPSSAPAGPYPTVLSALNAVNANGTWSLYVFDDSAGDSGSISNGWSLALTTITPVNQIADLGLTAATAPSPCLIGGTLTSIFTVTNGGPNNASSVAFTNVLPAGVTLVSAGASQGTVLTNASSVVVGLGSLNAGAIATVTNVVMVTTAAIPQGANSAALTNFANVAAYETDLNPANNSVAVVTTVNRPVADLGLAQTVAPDPVVVGYSLTNTIVITNHGPATGLSAVLKQPVPPAAGFVPGSSSTTAGTITNSAGVITCSLGDLASNATATVILVLTNFAPGLMTNTVALTSSSYDPILTNNSATYVATVVSPSPQITNVGAVLTYESGPVNAAVDLGETVTLSLALANIGSLDTANLKATLQASGGVTAPSGPQYYGTLVPGGPAVARSFTFTSASAPRTATVATLLLQDQNLGNNAPTVAFTFPVPVNAGFSSTGAIVIPDHGPGTPYPATISVSGLTGQVAKATVTLNRFAHSFPHDVDVVLVAPSGTNVLVMSHTGGGYAVTNLSFTFDDGASGVLPNYNPLTSGTYRPSNYEGPIALPDTVGYKYYQFALSAVNGSSPNGAWSLYVFDDTVGDAGVIAGGWTLGLTTAQVMPAAEEPASLMGAFTNGYFELTAIAPAGFVYEVQASTNLTSWMSIGTCTNTTGAFSFTDTTAPPLQLRYYRTMRQ